jgi:hypothetical protein
VSGAASFFGDFAQVNGVLIQNNLIGSQNEGVYGGSIPGKRYPHGINVRILSNAFQSGHGIAAPVVDFEPAGAGNVESGNTWYDGPNAGQPIPGG